MIKTMTDKIRKHRKAENNSTLSFRLKLRAELQSLRELSKLFHKLTIR